MPGAAPTAGAPGPCYPTAGETAAAGRFSPGSCVPAPLVPAQHLPARPPWLSAIGQRSVKSIAQRIAIAQRSPRAGMPPSQQRSIILFGLGRHGSRGVRIPAELIQVCTACAPDHADAPDPLLRLVVVACIHVPRSTCRVSVYCKNI